MSRAFEHLSCRARTRTGDLCINDEGVALDQATGWAVRRPGVLRESPDLYFNTRDYSFRYIRDSDAEAGLNRMNLKFDPAEPSPRIWPANDGVEFDLFEYSSFLNLASMERSDDTPAAR